MRPAGARDKGSEFEVVVAKAITQSFGLEPSMYEYNFPRSPDSGARETPAWKGDIAPVPFMFHYFPFVIECRFRQEWDFPGLMAGKSAAYAWFDEVTKHSLNVRVASSVLSRLEAMSGVSPHYSQPLLVFKRNRIPAMVMVNTHLVDALSANSGFWQSDGWELRTCWKGKFAYITTLTRFLELWQSHLSHTGQTPLVPVGGET